MVNSVDNAFHVNLLQDCTKWEHFEILMLLIIVVILIHRYKQSTLISGILRNFVQRSFVYIDHR